MAHDDAKAREDALTFNRSYIVQAPAGSGKTELLTQRYLTLLNTVDNPEQIVAITFTKKAASEMRARILSSLELGKKTSPPLQAHQQTTWQLAKAALKRDHALNWNLLLQPLRLRIKTIDSMCQFLCNQMPLTAGPTATLPVSDNVQQIYQAASAKCLEQLLHSEDYQKDICLLLTHLGNDQQRLIELFANLLAAREQWLPLLLKESNYSAKQLQQALNAFQEKSLRNCQETFPKEVNREFISLLPNFLASTTLVDDAVEVKSIEELDFSAWQTLSKLLLTTQGKFKARLTKREGFVSPSDLRTKEEKDKASIQKKLGQSLLETFSLHESFQNALIHCQKVPEAAPSESAFKLIQAMKKLLPVLAAFLEIHFKQHQCIDFNAISINALAALGEEDAPSDLMLYMDYKISHLLIDEFQDTSKQQFKLIERLTEDWHDNCGKTLFLVGDPMQSIYRFRQAEVACFLKAKEEGIGNIRLNFLKLSRNFRSSKKIVDYTNQTFKTLFPKEDNSDFGAVSYHMSVANNNDETESSIVLAHTSSKRDQAYKIADIIKKHDHKSIAVLTRTRNELAVLIQVLKEEKIPFQGVEIQELAIQSAISDLMSLTELFHQPGNALCLAEVLHSPFCGLSYQSIEKHYQKAGTLSFESLSQEQTLRQLTNDEERSCLRRFLECFQENNQRHCFLPFKERLYALFSLLGGYDLFKAHEKQSIDEFWSLLSAHCTPTQLKSLSLFKTEFSKKYAKDDTPSMVNLMTIHKSKGLEFETVILPSLEKKSSKSEPPLVRFTTVTDSYLDENLVIAPIKSVYQKEDKLYTYLNYLEGLKLDNELKRLLYVAVTRTKQNLYLLTTEEKGAPPPKKSFLSMLNINSELIDIESNDASISNQASHLEPNNTFVRVKSPSLNTQTNSADLFKETAACSLSLSNDYQDKIGTLLHELIDLYSKKKLSKHMLISFLEQKLSCLPLSTQQKQEARKKANLTLLNLEQCPIARWLLHPHSQASNEQPLIFDGRQYCIDRTFVEKDMRWIIDYKFGHSEPETYYSQLYAYANLYQNIEPQQAISCLLYYPLTKTGHFFSYIEGKLQKIPAVKQPLLPELPA
jgi:ATP-dependent exoDNAse (exonuclease V) beta subunit